MNAPTFFDTGEAFHAWLTANAHEASELLVGFYKVGSGRNSMRWSESVDQALCYGWIDGVRRRIDDKTYAIRFTPRQAISIWSAVNIKKVAGLLARGLMTPAGEDAFRRRSDAFSRVYAHERVAPARLMPEALASFQAQVTAWAYFKTCPPGYRHRMLHIVLVW